ncbi:MAG TPA: homoserine O-acetyltransferase [Gammaproteobacteria bacterium]|nr:homoserine O-acetyltransferase [Gammaproteobacteria bacterium]
MNPKTNNSIGIVSPQTLHFTERVQLKSGDHLEQFDVVYECYGKLNSNNTNAILICHALSGDHHAAGYHSAEDPHSGWWNNLIGPGKPIDTNRFFVICTNNLGGFQGSTGPASINPATNQPYGPDFPMVTVEDWVTVQSMVADRLKIDVWAAVIGGSLGGMQAMQWSIDYPSRIKHSCIIASTPKLSAQNIAFNDVARQAIRTDSEFYDGRYYEKNTVPSRGLRVARMLGHITYLSDDLMAEKFGRNLRDIESIGFNYNPEFEVESYLRYQGDRFAQSFDANTYLLMTKALDYYDPAEAHEGNLSRAMAPAVCNFLVISFTSDWRFTVERSREIVKAIHDNDLNVTYAEITASQGHDAFLLEIPDYLNVFYAYMDQVFESTLDIPDGGPK